MPKRKTRPRTTTLNIRVSDDLHAKIKAKAGSQNLSMATLVHKVLGNPPLRNYYRKSKLVDPT